MLALAVLLPVFAPSLVTVVTVELAVTVVSVVGTEVIVTTTLLALLPAASGVVVEGKVTAPFKLL